MNKNIGLASLLTVLAVLCMSVFAILTFTTAKADERLSKISADSVESYYRAEYEAQQILRDIRQGIIPENVTESNNEYTYDCIISEHLKLEVTVRDFEIISLKEKER